MSFKRVFVSCCALMLFGVLLVSPAVAQDYGARLGVSGGPNQFYFGGHVESSPIIEELVFRPNIEIGFGDDRTIVGLNGEFVWPFELDQGGSVYAGLGPAINIIARTSGQSNDTSVDPGLNFLVGYEFDQGYFAEIKVGVIDSPEFKFGFGYTWRR